MESENKLKRNTHHGHAVKRIRETLGIKQEVLADDLGLTQQCISNYEQKRVLDDDIIKKIASVLKVSPELIKELDEDPITVIIENNTFEDGSIANVAGDNTNNYHPIERIIELSNEKQALYERMLELEKEKIALLEKLLKEKK